MPFNKTILIITCVIFIFVCADNCFRGGLPVWRKNKFGASGKFIYVCISVLKKAIVGRMKGTLSLQPRSGRILKKSIKVLLYPILVEIGSHISPFIFSQKKTGARIAPVDNKQHGFCCF